jgi:hypothetical protein
MVLIWMCRPFFTIKYMAFKGVGFLQDWKLALLLLEHHGLSDGTFCLLDMFPPKGKGSLEVLLGFSLWVFQIPDSFKGGAEKSIQFMQHYQDLLGIIGLEVSLEDTEEGGKPCGQVEKGLARRSKQPVLDTRTGTYQFWFHVWNLH